MRNLLKILLQKLRHEEERVLIKGKLSVRWNLFTKKYLSERGITFEQAFSAKQWSDVRKKIPSKDHLLIIPHRFSDDIKNDSHGTALGVSYAEKSIVANDGKMHFGGGAVMFYLLGKN